MSFWSVMVLVGALTALGCGTGCTTDQPKKDHDAGAVDAGESEPAQFTDAGAAAATTDAGAIPVVTEQVDAGHMGDVQVNTVDGHAPVGPDLALKVQIFNRIMVKVAAKDMNPDELRSFVEDKTGQKLDKVRRTAGTFWLLQFTPVNPARTKAAQEALIQKLKDTKAFVVVEGDQVMTLKTP